MNVLDFAALGMRKVGDTVGFAADGAAAAGLCACWLACLLACKLKLHSI
jgi:hypothetical protein